MADFNDFFHLCPTSLNSNYAKAITEMVFNSLNANATCIAIRFNLFNDEIQIIDNGDGIAKHKLNSLWTEDDCETKKNGKKVRSLSAIISMSERVEIESLHKAASETYSKEIRKNVLFSSKINKVRNRKSVGTTIIVSNFAKKNRISKKLLNQNDHIEAIKKSIELIALVKFQTSFSVRNEHENIIVLEIPKTQTIGEKLSLLFNVKIQNDFLHAIYSKNNYSINLYITENWIATKKYQFLYINNRYIDCCKLYEYINQVFRKKWNEQKYLNKSTERYFPMFIMSINCPYFLYKIPTKMIEQFIENFILKNVRNEENNLPSNILDKRIQIKNTVCINKSQKFKFQNEKQGCRVTYENGIVNKNDHIQKFYETTLKSETKPTKYYCNSPIKRFKKVYSNVNRILKDNRKIYWTKKMKNNAIEKSRKLISKYKSKCCNKKNIFSLKNSRSPILKSKCVLRCFLNKNYLKNKEKNRKSTHISSSKSDVDRQFKITKNTNIMAKPSIDMLDIRFNLRKNPNGSLCLSSQLKSNTLPKNKLEAFQKTRDVIEPCNDEKSYEIFNNKNSNDESNKKIINNLILEQKNEKVQLHEISSVKNHGIFNKNCTMGKIKITEIYDNKLKLLVEPLIVHIMPKPKAEIRCIKRNFQVINDTIRNNKNGFIVQNLRMQNINLSGNELPKEICKIVDYDDKHKNLNVIEFKNLDPMKTAFYKVASRVPLIPKGFSQICRVSPELNMKLKNNEKTYFDIKFNAQRWKKSKQDSLYYNMSMYKGIQDKMSKTGIVIDSTKIRLTNLSNVIHQLVYSKNTLSTAKVINQVDKRYICTIIPKQSKKFLNLVLFDQHAVDERIKLEYIMKDYGDLKFKCIDNIKEIILSYDENILLTLSQYKNKFLSMGLSFEKLITFENKIKIKTIPMLLYEKYGEDIDTLAQKLDEMIRDEAEIIIHLKGINNEIPKIIFEAMCSEACHNAVKFGTSLKLKDCVNMIKNLSKCNTPFQCAHGRPVMTILTRIQNFDVNYMISKEKLKHFLLKNR